MARSRNVKKPLIMRAIELVRALQFIAEACSAVRAGKPHYLMPLAGQLRALLTDRDSRSKALLLDLSRELKKPVDVYVMPDTSESVLPEGIPAPLLHVKGFPLSAQQELRHQVKMPFDKFLDHQLLKLGEKPYTTSDLIKWFANWVGGAHYSKLMPEDLAKAMAFNVRGLAPVSAALVQIGEATLVAGRELIRQLVDLETHCLIVIPELPSKPSFLFDAACPGTSMRVSMILHPSGRLEYRIRGGQGSTAAVVSDAILGWTSAHHVIASINIDRHLGTVLELAFDGVEVGRSRADEPIFVASDPLSYEAFHNKPFNGKPQQFSFAMVEQYAWAKHLNLTERAKLVLHYDERRANANFACDVFEPGSYAHSPVGTNGWSLVGPVRPMTIKEMIKRRASAAPAPHADADKKQPAGTPRGLKAAR